MWRVLHKLYLGDGRDAKDHSLLMSVGITHILNCAVDVPCWYPEDFRYLHLELTDPDPEFHEHIEPLCAFIHRGRKRGAVLVHCRAGLSRSPSAILAYLCRQGMSLQGALRLLQRRVGESAAQFIEPDASFLEQLEVHFEDRQTPGG
jgi:protein-tyrosine phosphatase